MTIYPFKLDHLDSSWNDCLDKGLAAVPPSYLQELSLSSDWLPGPDCIFNAFSLPLTQVKYVLFGESPYPRKESANGYAFWDASVNNLWSTTGFSKKVNRATSLRNILKMLLVAEGILHPLHLGQEEIAKINKQSLVETNQELFNNLLSHGFLLLNASLVLQAHSPPKRDANAWRSFIKELLSRILQYHPQIKLLLLGKIANTINELIPNQSINILYAEHPYNLSFITNPEVLAFFRPFHLLNKTSSFALPPERS